VIRFARLLPRQPVLRSYALISLIESVGTSLFLTGSAVYFIRVVGLTTAQVGGGLSLAALLGVVTAIPGGVLGDRYGHRNVLLCSYVVRVPLFLSYLFVSGYASFLPVVCAVGLAENAGRAVRSAYIAVLVEKAGRLPYIAYSRSVTNAGYALGSLAAGAALAVPTTVSVKSLVVGNALAFAVAAVLLARLPNRTAAAPAAAEPLTGITRVARDRAYVVLAVLLGTLSVCSEFFTVGLPLWIVSRTSAPAWTVSTVLLLNTLLVIVLQVVVGRSADTPAGAARAGVRGGVALFVGCAVMAVSARPGTAGAIALVLPGTVLLTGGELYASAASWGLSFALAQDGHEGAYLGFWSFATQLMQALAPAGMGAVLVEGPAAGWLAFGAMFTIVSVAVVPGVRRAGSNRRIGNLTDAGGHATE